MKKAKTTSKGAKDKPFSGPVNCSQEQWDKIFGKKPRAKAGRYVWNGKEFVHESEMHATPVPENQAPAIHDDRVYTKHFDHGAGRKWNSRTERREWMKRNGIQEVG